jgi:hypothetical protein
MKDNKLIEGKNKTKFMVLQNSGKFIKFHDMQLKKLSEKYKEIEQVG